MPLISASNYDPFGRISRRGPFLLSRRDDFQSPPAAIGRPTNKQLGIIRRRHLGASFSRKCAGALAFRGGYLETHRVFRVAYKRFREVAAEQTPSRHTRARSSLVSPSFLPPQSQPQPQPLRKRARALSRARANLFASLFLLLHSAGGESQ